MSGSRDRQHCGVCGAFIRPGRTGRCKVCGTEWDNGAESGRYGVVWEIELLSFAGVVPWATHYQARLTGRVEDVDVLYLMSADDAKRMSEPDYQYRPGTATPRFFSRDEAVAAAVVAWRALAAERDVLLTEYGEKVLAGPDDLVAEAAARREADGNLWDWQDQFVPHECDTVFGRGAPPSVRHGVEVTLARDGDGWTVEEVEHIRPPEKAGAS